MKNQFMVDLETMGTGPYSVIMSIGVIAFDLETGEMGEEFYMTIDKASSEKLGLTCDPATVAWWKKQDPRIRRQMFINPSPLPDVLHALNHYFKKSWPKTKFLWGNSARFDLGLLECAYRKAGIDPVWAFWNERDCRTIVALAPKIKDMIPKPKNAHHPIVDCQYQIKYVTETYKFILS